MLVMLELTTDNTLVSHCDSSDDQIKENLYPLLLSCHYSVISRVSTGLDPKPRIGRVLEGIQWNCLQVQDRDP